MSDRVRIIEVTQTCAACPSQWDALTDDNRRVYIRYRWGYLSVRIGEPGDKAQYAAVRGREVFGCEYGDAMNGFLSESELVQLTNDAIHWDTGRIQEPR